MLPGMVESGSNYSRLRSATKRAATPIALAVAALFFPASARAQLTKSGQVDLLTAFIRGVDVAPDPSGGALVVSAQDMVVGHCVNADGVSGGPITIKPANGKPFGAFPRAHFSPASGRYLVIWPEEQLQGSLLRARTVSCPSGALGTETVIGATAWIESGAALDWSATSGLYLVAWKAFPSTLLQVQLVSADGTPIGGPVTVSSGFGRDPGVAWNPITNEFGVSFSGETPGGAYSAFAIVPAENPAAFRRTTFNAVAGGLTTITDLQFNPQTQHFVMTWFELTSGYFARIAEFDPTGSLLTQGIVSSTLGSYDSLGLSYNSLSGTFALVGVDRPSGSTDQLLAVELNSRGYRFANEQVIGTGLTPVTYPRVAASQQSSRWFTAFSKGNGQGARYQGTAEVIFNTATASGGPPGEYPGVPGHLRRQRTFES